MALPNACIIHTRRDPVDTCLSCFATPFETQPFSFDLGELGRYYRAYARLMAHWRAVLPPGAMLDVQYEELVADFEPQARRIIAHCGLAWDDACLIFPPGEAAGQDRERARRCASRSTAARSAAGGPATRRCGRSSRGSGAPIRCRIRSRSPIMPELSQARFTNLFASPLMAHVWADAAELNGELRERILTTAANGAGEAKTNVGGWHSEAGQLEFCGVGRAAARPPHVRDGRRGDAPRLGRVPPGGADACAGRLHAWVNVNRDRRLQPHAHASRLHLVGHLLRRHRRPAGRRAGTPLHLFDPCQGRANTFLPPLVPSSFDDAPEPGLMVLFPSYLPHMVFAAPRRPAADLDRLQPAQGAVSVTAPAAAGADETFRHALSLHRAGRLDDAEPLYRAVLAAQPGNFARCCISGCCACSRAGTTRRSS